MKKIYAAPVENWRRLLAEPFFGRKFAVCFANPQLSSVAKRQKVQMQPPPIFHSAAYIFFSAINNNQDFIIFIFIISYKDSMNSLK